MKCSACCKYAYEDQAMSNKTISFFQSPGYPDTRRDSYSSSLTLEIRHDVEQVLIEFIDFEMPISPDGVLGPGNSRFCGLNTDQHLYLDVKGGDLLIFKAVTSGVGFVPLAVGPDGVDYYDEAGSFVDVDEPTRYDEYGKPYGHGDHSYRFQVKITQILHKAPYRYLSQKGSGKGGASGNTLKIGNDDYASGYIQLQSDIPDYYRKLAAPRGCKQYYKDQSGTVESFNFDSNSRMPNNLDYSICFRVPEKSCGLSLSALKFDIPAWNPESRPPAAASHAVLQVCSTSRMSTAPCPSTASTGPSSASRSSSGWTPPPTAGPPGLTTEQIFSDISSAVRTWARITSSSRRERDHYVCRSTPMPTLRRTTGDGASASGSSTKWTLAASFM